MLLNNPSHALNLNHFQAFDMNFSKLLFALLLVPKLTFSQVGNPAPNFTVTDTHGEMHTLYEYLDAGKVVVLDFYFTTCIPCQYYSPQVNLAYENYGCNDANVIFMGIDYQNTDAEVMAYDQTYNIHYPSISGKDGGGNGVVSAYGVSGFPTFYVIDSTRIIIEEIDPPTLQVFNFRFQQLGIEPANCLTGTNEAAALNRLDIYPNPVYSGETFQLTNLQLESGQLSLRISDLSGRILQSEVIDYQGETNIELKPINLYPGAYVVQISSLDSRRSYSNILLIH